MRPVARQPASPHPAALGPVEPVGRITERHRIPRHRTPDAIQRLSQLPPPCKRSCSVPPAPVPPRAHPMRAPNVTSVPFRKSRHPPVRADAAPKGCPPENVSLCAVQSSLRPARHPCDGLHRGTGRPTSRQGLPRPTARRRAQRMPARHVTCSPGQAVRAPAHDPRDCLHHVARRQSSAQRWPRTAQPYAVPPRMPPDKHLMCHPIILVARLWPARLPPPGTRSPGTISGPPAPRSSMPRCAATRPKACARGRSSRPGPLPLLVIADRSPDTPPTMYLSHGPTRAALHPLPDAAEPFTALPQPRQAQQPTAPAPTMKQPHVSSPPAIHPPSRGRASRRLDRPCRTGPLTPPDPRDRSPRHPHNSLRPKGPGIARNPPRPLGRDGALVTLPVPAFPP